LSSEPEVRFWEVSRSVWMVGQPEAILCELTSVLPVIRELSGRQMYETATIRSRG
jgi:hypothetical protein